MEEQGLIIVAGSAIPPGQQKAAVLALWETFFRFPQANTASRLLYVVVVAKTAVNQITFY